MDFWRFFPLGTNVLLLMLALYGVSGIIRNIFEINTLDFKSSSWPLNACPLNVVSILIQTIMTLGALLGIFGTFKKNAAIIYCTAFFLLGVFVPYTVFGVFVIKGLAGFASNNELSHALFKILRDRAGNDSAYFQWMSDFQYENKCCGVFSYMDWKMIDISPSVLPPTSVPSTCCFHDRFIPSPDCGIDILRTNQSVNRIRTIVYGEGCGPKLTQIYSQHLLGRGVELIGLGLVCLLIALFICYGISKTYTLVTVQDNGNGTGLVRLVANDDPVYIVVAKRQLYTLIRADGGDCNVASVQNMSKNRKRQQQKLDRVSIKKFGPSSKQRRINEQRFQNKTQVQAPPQFIAACRKDSDSGHISAIPTEMLLHPASDKYSAQSTCPYSSTTQNLWFGNGWSHSSDSHPSKPFVVPSTRNPSSANAGLAASGAGAGKEKGQAIHLPYYSSLPQVHIQTPPSSCHHHQRGWLPNPHKKMMSSPSTVAGVDNSFPPVLVNLIAQGEQAQTNNNSLFCDAPELETLVPTTIGLKNGNLLIMEEHEKPAPNSDVQEDEDASVTRIPVEYLADHVESVMNLSVIAEEDFQPGSTGTASGTRFDEVVQARINYLEMYYDTSGDE